jgi:hypothetical protein
VVARLGDAARGDRVGAQELRQIAFIEPACDQHAVEEGRHVARIETSVGEHSHTDTVGLLLEAASKVELTLGERGGRQGNRRLAARMSGAGQQNGRQQRRHGRDAGALGLRHHARDMALGQVGDFVGEHRGQLALAACRQYQAGMHADKAAGHGKRVDAGVVDQEKIKVLPPGLGAGGQVPAEILDVTLELRILDDVEMLAGPSHEVFTELALLQR